MSGLFGDEVDGIDRSDGLLEESGFDGDADEHEEENAEDLEDDHGSMR